MPKTIQKDQAAQAQEAYSVEELLEELSEGVELLDAARIKCTSAHILASFLNRLSVEDCRTVLRKLPEIDASAVLAEMDVESSAEVVATMREWRALKILEEFDLDDAADVISELDEFDRVRLLSKLSPEKAKKVRALLKYAPDTAGGVMNPAFFYVYTETSVDEAIERIRRLKDEVSHTSYVYVVDHSRRLVGVFSLRTLLLANPKQLVDDFMTTDLRGVCSPHEDRETLARTMAELNLFDLPVVDEKGRMLGIVEHDDVLDIVQTEATEDFQKLVGAGADEAIHDPISYSIKRRFPWLMVNLITAILGALVISLFQDDIQTLPLLAALLPAIASLGGNTGSQTLAVAIRSLALGDIEDLDNFYVCIKEGAKGLLNGILVGAVSAISVYLITKNNDLALVFFLAMMLNMGVGGVAGAFIPLMLKRVGLDPAQSSSIFLTGMTDVCGFFIFLSLGAWFLF